MLKIFTSVLIFVLIIIAESRRIPNPDIDSYTNYKNLKEVSKFNFKHCDSCFFEGKCEPDLCTKVLSKSWETLVSRVVSGDEEYWYGQVKEYIKILRDQYTVGGQS